MGGMIHRGGRGPRGRNREAGGRAFPFGSTQKLVCHKWRPLEEEEALVTRGDKDMGMRKPLLLRAPRSEETQHP